MALKPHINSLRCKQWYGFAKNKLLQLKNYNIPGKTYLINGYQIILKALIDLAIIKAPPGIAYIAKDLGAFRIFYADHFGYGKEKAFEVKELFDVAGYTITPESEGWPGSFMANNLGADYVKLHYSFTTVFGVTSDEYPAVRYCWIANAFPPAANSFAVQQTLAYQETNTEVLRIQSGVIANNWYIGTLSSDTYFTDASAEGVDFFWYKIKPFPKPGVQLSAARYTVLDSPDYDSLEDLFPNGSLWTYATVPYAYVWKHFNNVSNRDVAKYVFYIYTETSGFTMATPYFLFAEVDPTAEVPNNIVFRGYTSGNDVRLLDEDNLPITISNKLVIQYLVGYPNSAKTYMTNDRNVIFPLANGELAICYYNYSDLVNTPVKFVINESNTPRLYPALNVPFDPVSYGDEKYYVFPACLRVDEAEGIYLYWDEYCLFGDVVNRHFPIKIVNFKYGSPYSGWLDFPALSGELIGFTPVKITWNHQIILASVYITDGDNSGTYGALLDTEKNSDWIIGKRFSIERLDRTTPVIFGEHPYVEARKTYGGTQWAWDYTFSDNYAR